MAEQNSTTKKNQMGIAVQKTFTFPPNTTQDKIDSTINEWLEKQARMKRPAQLGKYLTNGKTGEFIAVFLYTKVIEID
jgi:hypothetical protein